MNEFEKMLQSMKPADGRTDAMQIMFVAGQQSCQPDAGVQRAWRWKLATGSLAACLVLLFGYSAFLQNRLASQSEMIKAAEMESQVNERPTELNPSNQLAMTAPAGPIAGQIAGPEIDLEMPTSWKSLGPRAVQLKSVTDDSSAIHKAEMKLTPFSGLRALSGSRR